MSDQQAEMKKMPLRLALNWGHVIMHERSKYYKRFATVERPELKYKNTNMSYFYLSIVK
jgi:hypothetical protein